MSTRTANQNNASRINGAHSNGPVSTDGKLRIAQNAVTHGLSAKTVVLSNESPDAYNQLLQSFTDRFQPVDDLEWLLVEELATHTWRIRRCWTIQTQQLELQMARDEEFMTKNFAAFDEPMRIVVAENHLVDDKAVERMRKHEERLSRLFNRALRQLRQLQSDRLHNQPAPAPDPIPVAANANSQNKPDPQRIFPIEDAAKPQIQTEPTEKENQPCTGPAKTPKEQQ